MTPAHPISTAPAYSEVADMFPKPFVDRVETPRAGRSPEVIFRCVWLNRKAGLFQVVCCSTLNLAQTYSRMNDVERVEAADREHKPIVNLTHLEAEEIINRERRRWAAWAELADHLAGVEVHDLESLKQELNLGDDQIAAARKAIQDTLSLTPKCDSAALAAAEATLNDHIAQHGDLKESRRQLEVLEDERRRLKSRVKNIPTDRHRLRNIAVDWPFLFQSAEEIQRFHPFRKARRKGA